MSDIRTDRREIHAAEDAERERRVAADAAAYFDLRLRLARDLVALERQGTYHRSGASSIVHYAVLLGIPSAEARRIVDLGHALDLEVDGGGEGAPVRTLEELVRSRAIPVENGGDLGRLREKAGLARVDEAWLRRATTLGPPAFRRLARQRIEEVAQGEPELTSITVHVPERVRDDFRRARVLASRAAEFALTEGQAFAVIVRRYLDAEDPLRRGAGARRVGPTSERPGDRYVPADVRRAVRERSGDRCEVPGCTHDTFLELAHIRPHAEGGDREAENLLDLCGVHHVHFDAGLLLFCGWRDGHPVLRNVAEEELRWGVRAPTHEVPGGGDCIVPLPPGGRATRRWVQECLSQATGRDAQAIPGEQAPVPPRGGSSGPAQTSPPPRGRGGGGSSAGPGDGSGSRGSTTQDDGPGYPDEPGAQSGQVSEGPPPEYRASVPPHAGRGCDGSLDPRRAAMPPPAGLGRGSLCDPEAERSGERMSMPSAESSPTRWRAVPTASRADDASRPADGDSVRRRGGGRFGESARHRASAAGVMPHRVGDRFVDGCRRGRLGAGRPLNLRPRRANLTR